jgi:hypothetical protein
MISLFKKPKLVESTPFSDFIRNAKAAEKKRVYTAVLERATERQNAFIRKSQAIR